MLEAEVYSALTPIFQDILSHKDLILQPDLSARDVDGWDSMKQIEIVMAVEERLSLKFSTRELDSLRTVGDLVSVIVGKTGTR